MYKNNKRNRKRFFFYGGDFIRIELLLIVILIVFVLVYFYIIEPYINKSKINNKNEYGSARFSTFQEINKYFKKENIDNISDTGIPVWYSKDYKTIWFDRETPHYVYLGSTGSGKSVTCVIPTCSFIANAKNKRSVFITDPKGEIYNTTSQMFKDNGYEIYTIDFRKPELSNKINFLTLISQSRAFSIQQFFFCIMIFFYPVVFSDNFIS